MKRNILSFVFCCLLASVLVCENVYANDGEHPEDKELFLATTTSVVDTGLLDYLSPLFAKDTGYTLKFLSVGTGEALALGRNGDVDILWVHAKALEEEFIRQGYGLARIPVMYNEFIVVGPKDILDKKQFDTNHSVKEVFRQIYEKQVSFISRGDQSGTHHREMTLWQDLGLDPKENSKYFEAGQGMGATLGMAEEMRAFTLTDRGTWLKIFNHGEIESENVIIFEYDEVLRNQYSLITINPEKCKDVNSIGARVFIDWLTSKKIQALIALYGKEEFGQSLFVPNAKISDNL